jgi:hypothetical protein
MLQKFDQNGFGKEECCNSWHGSLYAQRADDCFVLLNKAKQSPKADVYMKERYKYVGKAREEKVAWQKSNLNVETQLPIRKRS